MVCISNMINNKASSEDLMARIAEGDEDAFEILVNRHQTSVLNLIYRFIGDRTQAKDLAQEVFLRVWQAAKTYKPEAKFTTWIYRITANLCINELKSSRRRKLFQFLRFGEDQENTIEESPRRCFTFARRSAIVPGAEPPDFRCSSESA